MSHHKSVNHGSRLQPGQADTEPNAQKMYVTVIMLLVVYYAYPCIAYHTTVKRSVYEATLRLIPSQFILAVRGLVLPHPTAGNQRSIFDTSLNTNEKHEALQQIYHGSPIPMVLQKAMDISRFDRRAFGNSSSELTYRGLGNMDYSCFQNSVLQGLASLPIFQQFLQDSLRQGLSVDVDAKTHESLLMLLVQLSEASTSSGSMWTPDILKKLDSWQQQDAQEYLGTLMEGLEKEAVRSASVLYKRTVPGLECLMEPRNRAESVGSSEASRHSPGGSRDGKSPDARSPPLGPSDCDQGDQTQVNQTRSRLMPPNPIEGLTAQKVECKYCHFSEGLTYTSFTYLTLHPEFTPCNRLCDLLDKFCEPELVHEVECDSCTKRLRAGCGKDGNTTVPGQRTVLTTKFKQVTVGKLPQDLVFHINRNVFTPDGRLAKNQTSIEYPPVLEMLPKWCTDLGSADDRVRYELRGVITHQGTHDDGHYVTIAKREKEWFKFNDEHVTHVSAAGSLTFGNVYMLLYERAVHGSGPAIEGTDDEKSLSSLSTVSSYESEVEPDTVMESRPDPSPGSEVKGERPQAELQSEVQT